MIPTIEQILADMAVGEITAEQAIAWINEHLRLAQESAQDGLRDVLWSLLNTKEFLLNN